MSFLVKICGLRTSQAALCALNAGANLLGLVFYGKSPRHLALSEAASLTAALPPGTPLVGLFVDAEDTEIAAVLAQVPLTHLQLHGGETPDKASSLKARFGLPVIKALGVATTADVTASDAYAGAADFLLFDAKPPPDADRPGGHGMAFGWQALAGVSGRVPWLLAGGLTPDNVYDAVFDLQHLPGFAGVDVSSGVEQMAGEKSAALIEKFVSQALAAMSETVLKDA